MPVLAGILAPSHDKKARKGQQYSTIGPRGPIPYLFFLHEMSLLDLALLVMIGLSLAFPVFVWMRSHWLAGHAEAGAGRVASRPGPSQ